MHVGNNLKAKFHHNDPPDIINLMFSHSQHTCQMLAHLKSSNFHLIICQFPKGTPMEMNHFDMKLSNFQID